MKAWFATIVYVIVIIFMALCAGAIVYKLLFTVPCSPTGPNGSLCGIDEWSLAGLAGSVLGVAATVLAIIGASAVAYWWIKLDNRVNDQVSTLYETQKAALNTQMADLLKEQKATISKEVYDLLEAQRASLHIEVKKLESEQRAVFDIQRNNLDRTVDSMLDVQRMRIEAQDQVIGRLNRELKQMQEIADNIIELTLSVATVNPPWELETWAKYTTDRFKTASAAKHMVLSYLKIVDGLLSPQATELAIFMDFLFKRQAPSTNLSYYWNKALEWEQVLTEYFEGVLGVAAFSSDGKSVTVEEPEELKQMREAINQHRPRVEQWMSQHHV